MKVTIRDLIIKTGLCVLPLVLTVIMAALISGGYVWNGKQALVLLVPWLEWSMVYTVCYIFLWVTRMPLKSKVVFSVGGSTALIGLAWVMMAIWAAGFNGYALL